VSQSENLDGKSRRRTPPLQRTPDAPSAVGALWAIMPPPTSAGLFSGRALSGITLAVASEVIAVKTLSLRNVNFRYYGGRCRLKYLRYDIYQGRSD
jgi:hypothetical protein